MCSFSARARGPSCALLPLALAWQQQGSARSIMHFNPPRPALEAALRRRLSLLHLYYTRIHDSPAELATMVMLCRPDRARPRITLSAVRRSTVDLLSRAKPGHLTGYVSLEKYEKR